jgi:hypothetical protein
MKRQGASTPKGKSAPSPSSKHRIDPYDLDIVEQDNLFTLCLAGEPLKMPAGHPFTHPSCPLLEHVRRDLSAKRVLDLSKLGAYSFFCTQKDFIELGQDNLLGQLEHALEHHDPLLRRSAGPEGMHQLAYWYFVVEFLREAKCRLPWFPLTDEEKSN